MNLADALSQRLREHANPDGGWGYTPGSRSRVEPTSWALLALTASGEAGGNGSPDQALRFLRHTQTARGLLADVEGGPPNYAFSALAALAVDAAATGRTERWTGAIAEAIVGGRGAALAPAAAIAQRNSLQAWPWVDGCFSWVEPTAWCLLLLKRLRARLPDRRVPARIAEAERVLDDRACAGGGWNYGNASVLGQSLDPFVPTTAMALLALQDRRDLPSVQAGLRYLGDQAQHEPSGMALALGLICVGQYGVPTDKIEEALAAQYERTQFLGQQHVTAMALYALATSRSGAGAFHV